MNSPVNIIGQARRVIAMEADALQQMSARLGTDFERAVQAISRSRGRLVVVGMGKSGHIGRKIAATLASTGTPAFFVHPGEAFHGDLGMIQPEDAVLAISNSGETDEIVRLLPFFQQQGNCVVAMTGGRHSALGRAADVVLDIGVETEACSNNLAPTSSTTATLVMGDALAVTLSVMRGFQPEDFARFHPGGSLGRKLLTRVSDVMQSARLPYCSVDASFREIVHAITRGRLGLVLVGDADNLEGLITDGDIRRAFEMHSNPMVLRAQDIMSPQPWTIGTATRYAEAEAVMREQSIHSLVALSPTGQVCGIVQLLRNEASIPAPRHEPVAAVPEPHASAPLRCVA
jgi:arabinose-5-phosphate isomerase